MGCWRQWAHKKPFWEVKPQKSGSDLHALQGDGWAGQFLIPKFECSFSALELSLLEFGRGATGYVRRERWSSPNLAQLKEMRRKAPKS
mmetsp:Transcript_27484/g.59784  ORF Transcript_27484/g.59784 Transcript_27484/m.59784 type:complete len:88 (+) Transcript_27484:296-559(+)